MRLTKEQLNGLASVLYTKYEKVNEEEIQEYDIDQLVSNYRKSEELKVLVNELLDEFKTFSTKMMKIMKSELFFNVNKKEITDYLVEIWKDDKETELSKKEHEKSKKSTKKVKTLEDFKNDVSVKSLISKDINELCSLLGIEPKELKNKLK